MLTLGDPDFSILVYFRRNAFSSFRERGSTKLGVEGFSFFGKLRKDSSP